MHHVQGSTHSNSLDSEQGSESSCDQVRGHVMAHTPDTARDSCYIYAAI